MVSISNQVSNIAKWLLTIKYDRCLRWRLDIPCQRRVYQKGSWQRSSGRHCHFRLCEQARQTLCKITCPCKSQPQNAFSVPESFRVLKLIRRLGYLSRLRYTVHPLFQKKHDLSTLAILHKRCISDAHFASHIGISSHSQTQSLVIRFEPWVGDHAIH